MANGQAASPKVVALVLTLLLGAFAGWLAFNGLRDGRLASASEPSTCSVLGAGIAANEGAHVPWVILVHTITGERFERRDEGPAKQSAAEARQMIAELTPGEQLPCRYVAGAPSLVVYFERDPASATRKLYGAAALAAPIALALGWFVVRFRRG